MQQGLTKQNHFLFQNVQNLRPNIVRIIKNSISEINLQTEWILTWITIKSIKAAFCTLMKLHCNSILICTLVVSLSYLYISR